MGRARVVFWSVGALSLVPIAGIVALHLGIVTVSVRDRAMDARTAAARYKDAPQNVAAVRAGDPEVMKAQAQARATLADFWRAKATPGPGEEGFALKVAFRDRAGPREHMWLNNIEHKDGKLSGVLMNDPLLVRGMQRGERIEFQESEITDWTYMRFGKIVGSYTMLPLLKQLPPEEAARYRAMLADP